MKITAQEEYGLRCLLRLARAGDGQALTIPEIAEAEKLSAPYVAKLLSVLRQAGLITSTRGRSGGYCLARPASEVHLGEVMRALGEPLFEDPSYCERHAGPETGGTCVHNDGCTLRVIWQTLEQWMRRLLDQLTLADLLQSQEQIAERLHAHLQTDTLEPLGALLTIGSAGRA
ncbi:MAG TPA: Rrf2 family transcriptional regulator [Gemmataceae bacterium]|nr:Rrf2 family transcriptional regulator [Gemmataceae bacterium]